MSNNTNTPAAGPQYQPGNPHPAGQDAAGAVSQSGTATATGPGLSQHPRATIRRATLPGQDAPATDSGPCLSNPAAPEISEIVAALQEAAATAPALPDIVAALQKTTEKYSFTAISAALQKVTSIQEAGILQMKTTAAVCISINATPAGISKQINYFAGFDLSYFNKLTTGIFAKLATAAAKIEAYFRAELVTNPYYFELVAEKEAAERDKEAAHEAAARAIAEKEATAAELEKCRAELALYKAAVNLQEIIKQLPPPATTAGPQSGHKAKQPGHPQQSRRADFMPSISPGEIARIYAKLPYDFKPKEAQFAALFGKPIKMPAPIETTPARAAALLAALYTAGYINAAQYAATAAACKCFKYNGKTITAVQLRRAKESNKYSASTLDFDYIKAINNPR